MLSSLGCRNRFRYSDRFLLCSVRHVALHPREPKLSYAGITSQHIARIPNATSTQSDTLSASSSPESFVTEILPFARRVRLFIEVSEPPL